MKPDANPGQPEQPAQPAADSAPRLHLAGLQLQELRQWFVAQNEPAYRANQVLDWIYRHGATSFEQMTNLSQLLRRRLEATCVIYSAEQACVLKSADGTQKLLLRFPDQAAVETVWIPEPPRQTVCLSTQVGCAMGCRFCASGLGGLERNLTAGEIVEQALHVRGLLRRTLSDPQARLTNVVFMGMGEPLANYASFIAALKILNASWGMGIGARKITVSTVGLPAQIRRLADENLQVNLALSLHAADEKLRGELIPRGCARLTELLEACRYYFERTGREITLEYVLLSEVNDSLDQADRLAAIAKRLRANVNLLRYNPVPGIPYRRPSAKAAYQFQQRLRQKGVNVHLRTSRGSDIQAACGQLRRRTDESLPQVSAPQTDIAGPG
jgi:23S rRNA (adenine2503-C2)-methyltransferase